VLTRGRGAQVAPPPPPPPLSHTAATPAVRPRSSDTLYVSPRIRCTCRRGYAV
jgi:hypothetical protein